MKYAIDRLDQLLTETLSPDKFTIAPVTDQQAEDALAQVKQEQQLIRQFLWSKASKAAAPHAMTPLIALCQASVTRLMDTLYSYRRKTARNPALHHCYQTLYGELDSLVRYVERHFPGYLNGEQKLPEGYAVIIKRRVNRKAADVKTKLLAAGIHPELARITVEGLRLSLTELTYNKQSYCSILLAAVEDKTVFTGAADPNQRLAEKLISLNYNYPPFVMEVIRYMHGEIEKMHTQPAKRERLLFYCKEIRQIMLRPTLSWDSEHPSASKQISDWLKWELQYLEKHGSLPSVSRDADNTAHILTSLDGAHIYLLVMLSIDAGMILNHQYGSLAELIAPVIATRHKKGLSPESLKKYKDKISPQVRDEVKRVLRKMIELSDTV